ncbi:uncharacterized protein LOC135461640 [Liolophura sinensis]|uniref:uncharacterized protein LOC135461640 n=1 Tax=Liolophura sinensis TaxID=3198878 RepID=UPI003158F5D5
MKTLVTLIACLLYVTVTSAQDCSAIALESRYKSCLDQFINTYYSPTANGTASQADCVQARDEGVACVTSLLTDCSSTEPQLTKIIVSANAEKAFDFACDRINDVSLANQCYKTVNASSQLQGCEQTKRQETSQLLGLGNNATNGQSLCVFLEAHSTCLASRMQSQCQSQSVEFVQLLGTYLPTDCATLKSDPTAEEEKSPCGDDAVMVNFTVCVKPFFDRIESLDLEKKKCDESVTETLKCVAKIVKKCAKEEFKYIQKLLDLARTKNALDFGCSRNWNLSAGAFCYNKHYGSDIKPCLDIKMRDQKIYASEKERTFKTVCRYIDATTDCAKSGMETCKDEAVTFTEYVKMFFPRDCTEDNNSASSVSSAVLGLLTSLLLVHALL